MPANAGEDAGGWVATGGYPGGGIRVGDDLFLPDGVADSSVCFAFVAIRDILAAMVTPLPPEGVEPR